MNPNDESDLLAQNIARVQLIFWLGLKSETHIIKKILPTGTKIKNQIENFKIPQQLYFKGILIEKLLT